MGRYFEVRRELSPLLHAKFVTETAKTLSGNILIEGIDELCGKLDAKHRMNTVSVALMMIACCEIALIGASDEEIEAAKLDIIGSLGDECGIVR